MNATILHRAGRTGFGLLALVLLAGCANSPSWGAWSRRPTDAEVAAVLARTADPVARQSTAPQPTTLLAATGR